MDQVTLLGSRISGPFPIVCTSLHRSCSGGAGGISLLDVGGTLTASGSGTDLAEFWQGATL
jgi:hypothetical protein